MENIKNKKIIYVKYSELTLKKKNRMFFVTKLHKNICHALKEFSLNIKYYYDYIEIKNFNEEKINEIFEILKFIPGINSYSLAYSIEKDINKLNFFCHDLAKKNIDEKKIKTFRITCHRQDKTFLQSNEIINIVAKNILSNTNLKVSMTEYDWNSQIEVKNNEIIIYDLKNMGSNGLPIDSSGRILMLLSGGIDSPIASRLLMNRGLRVDFITFITPPHTSEMALKKVKMLVNKITLKNRLYVPKLFVCNFSNLLHELNHINKESYKITLMRRRFIIIAKEIAKQNNCTAIATGESLGQVASQTIESMNVINESANNFLIMRPLLAMDKQEIIKLAKYYGTYEISILPYEDSCSLFAPKNPITQPQLSIAIKLEQQLNLLDDLTNNIINNHTKNIEV